MISESVLKNDEKAIFKLRNIYQKYGYTQYKMSKFEEYDLYVRNKKFLVSDNIITFTDTDGKLMALKPDVTLSMIKNTKDEKNTLQKVYYNENVYRVSKGTNSFKEIMQTGLECIGDIDDYLVFEVISLAAKSLESISEDYVLDISHLGIISDVIDSMNITEKGRKDILKCISQKNVHGILEVCEREGADGETLKNIVSTYGSPEKVISMLGKLKNDGNEKSISDLVKIVTALENGGFKGKINIDFSVVSDTNYYNGFVFKGYVKGIASSVLTGGQYDNLMHKMGRKLGAIGFAVYLDMLERLDMGKKDYDVDAVMLYDDASDLEALTSVVNDITSDGMSVKVVKSIPENIKYKKLLKLNGKGVETLEDNA